LVTPILGDIGLKIVIFKAIMSIKKRETNDNIRAISIEENKANIEANEPVFSKGLYDWVMFIFVYYSRIRETLKIDFESFIVLQVVVSHSLYHLNKEGAKKFSEIEKNVELLSMSKLRENNKLSFASIAEVLQLPRETVRRKVLELNKKEIVQIDNISGIKLGPAYKTIYKEFVSKTTVDMSSLIKKWKISGALDRLLQMEKKDN
jgi:predicted transcriptional regulator